MLVWLEANGGPLALVVIGLGLSGYTSRPLGLALIGVGLLWFLLTRPLIARRVPIATRLQSTIALRRALREQADDLDGITHTVLAAQPHLGTPAFAALASFTGGRTQLENAALEAYMREHRRAALRLIDRAIGAGLASSDVREEVSRPDTVEQLVELFRSLGVREPTGGTGARPHEA